MKEMIRIGMFSLLLFAVSTQGLFKYILGFYGFFEIILALVSLFGVASILFNFKLVYVRKFALLFFALFVAIIISGLNSSSSFTSIIRGYYIYWLVPFAIIFLLVRPISQKNLKVLINVFCMIVAFNSIISLYRFFIDPTLGGYYIVFFRRSMLFRSGDLSAESIIFGPTMALITGFVMSVYYFYKEKKYLILAILTAVSAISALSRSSIVILLFVALGVFVHILRNISYEKILLLNLGILIVGILYLYAIQMPLIKDAIIEIGSLTEAQTYYNRFSTYEDFLAFIINSKSSEVFFGLGPGNIQPSTLGKVNRLPFVVESYWLTMMGEIGILGFIFTVGLYWYLFKRNIYRFSIIVMAGISLCIVNMFSASLLGVYTQVFFWSTMILHKLQLCPSNSEQ